MAVRGVSLKIKKLEGGWGEGAAPPPQMHWVLLHLFVLHVLFCSSVFFFVLMGRGVAVRGVILKNKKAGGGLGRGRSASPPDALGVVALVRVAFLVLFFRFFPNSYVLCFLVLRVFLEERCGGERSHP